MDWILFYFAYLTGFTGLTRFQILHFQFPEKTENIQSPPANKNGNHNTVKRLNQFSSKDTKKLM